ncbi:hypothetical protein BD309DRAFT_959332 [Dichomitus squalens]|uniref:Uncharacterized protein n=1 Tax=Dichomitus squalens TaxID=114155 RepID=A0A4Q9PK43_9APHY|nr:hypothetical protein BD309DRAFT_959332 [Dichomitus squalens]TBU54474.1 hypothetical protein BD310DRAFT_935864 [Dichomitus squalens]
MKSMHMDRHDAKARTALNLDVLRTVISFLPVADLKEIAVVSQPLHEEASREILSRGVHLRSNATKLKSFCDFMLKRDPPLFPYLRTFTLEHLPHRYVDQTAIDPTEILEVLSRAVYLRYLRIRWSDFLFTAESDKRLFITLPKLPDLRRLEVWTRSNTTDTLVAETVLNLRSQLRTLDVPSDPDNQLSPDFPNLLAEKQQSLYSLRICYPSLTNTQWAPFPSVRVLYLQIGDKLPSLPQLAQIFPALRELSVSAVGFEVDFAHPSPEHVRARNEALAFQNSGKGWKSLDVLTAATIGDPWVLCLTCPVGSVSLGHYDVGSHRAFVDVVSGTRPRKVAVHLACAQYCVRPDGLQNIFVFPSGVEDGTEEGVRGVTHAVLMVSISSFNTGQDTATIIDTIASHVKDSALEYIHIGFAEFFMSGELDERILKPEDIHEEVKKVIQEIDLELLVSGIVAAGTRLRFVAVTAATRDQSMWAIDRTDNGQLVGRVKNAFPAREIIDREERRHKGTGWFSQ